MKILVEQIAKTAYEALRAVGCDIASWDVASADDKKEALDSVNLLLENPDFRAKEMYQNESLEILKKHPGYEVMEWDDLGENEKRIYKVFFAVVDSLRLSAVR